MINLPDMIPVNALGVSKEYDEDKIAQYAAVYAGGSLFKQFIEDFLPKRAVEEKNEKYWDERVKGAYFIPRASGLIDWLCAAIFKDGVTISAPDDPTGYWEGKNDDADGQGTPLDNLCRQAAHEIMINKRAYWMAHFDSYIGDYRDKSTMAANFKILGAAAADDFQRVDGVLQWLRTHTYEDVRTPGMEYLPPELERHCWTWFDETKITTMEAFKPCGQDGWPKDKEGKEPVMRKVSETPHDFGTLPIFEIRSTDANWVMERVFDTVKALFACETALTFCLNSGAYSLLILMLEEGTEIDKIVASQMAALRIKTTEKVDFKAPPVDVYEPLFKQCDRLRLALYEIIQAMAMQAMALQNQNARQSAMAKSIDLQPLTTMILSFQWPIIEALQRLIEAEKIYRGEPALDVQVIVGKPMADPNDPENADGQEPVSMEDIKDMIMGEKPDVADLPIPKGEGEKEDDSEEEPEGNDELNTDSPLVKKLVELVASDKVTFIPRWRESNNE